MGFRRVRPSCMFRRHLSSPLWRGVTMQSFEGESSMRPSSTEMQSERRMDGGSPI
jgi:hypothetical protein